MKHQKLLLRIGLAMTLMLLVAWASASAQTSGVTGGKLNVALSEWSMGFSQARASNGRLALTVKNAGAYRHNLRIVNQAGAVLYKSRVLNPGQSHRPFRLPADGPG